MSAQHHTTEVFSAYEGRKMVDGDDGASLAHTFRVDLDGGFGERSVDVVNGDRVVRVGGATVSAEKGGHPRIAYSQETSTTTDNRLDSPA